jgi:galactose mutarotase-like enzyme
MITLKNETLQILIDPHGAELKQVTHAKLATQYLWIGNPDVWKRTAPVLFPIVGKVKENKLCINGNTYPMPQHGFARDMEFLCIDQSDTSAVFLLQSNEETLQFYPYAFTLAIRYELVQNKVKCTYTVSNTGDIGMYFSIGAHPGFLLQDGLQNYMLTFDNDDLLHAYSLQDGLLSNSYMYELNQRAIFLEPTTFAKDALVFKSPNSKRISLVHQLQPHQVSVEFDSIDYLGIWAPKGCTNMVCIEPWWGVADLVSGHQDICTKKGINHLMPGKKNDFSFSMQFD